MNLLLLNLTFRTAKARSVIGEVRFTHRLSHRQRMARIGFVENKVLDYIKASDWITTEDLKVWEKSYRDNPGVTFKRGKIRVNGTYTILLPILKTGKFGWFITAFNRYWIITSKLSRIERMARIYRQLFGADCLNKGKIMFTRKFWILLASQVFYRRYPYRLSIKKTFLVTNLTWRYRKLRTLVISQGWPLLRIWMNQFRELHQFTQD